MSRILVTRSSMPEYEEYIEEIKDIWDSHWLTNMGAKHNELEKELEKYLKVDHVSLFSNGHMALELLIQALHLTGEVITTPFTFASTTHAIVRNGLTPVFCDVNPEDYTMDVSKIEALITDKTSAIIPVHVYGNLCDVEAIEAIAKKHHLKVIYDAAHTFGVTYKGRGVATFGDASMFSFHATKVFHTIEGGAVCFNGEQNGLKEDLYGLKNFGIRNEVVVDAVGANSKMNEFQAAMGICNLRHVNGEIEKRRHVAERYLEHLEGVKGLKLPSYDNPDWKPNYAYFPVVFDGFVAGRDLVWDYLASHKIYSRKYFYPLTNEFQCYQGRFSGEQTPVAKYVADRVLTLPMYADLAMEDVDRICGLLKEIK